MLTADLVRARRRGDALQLLSLSSDARDRALVMAERYLKLARAAIGEPRGTLDELFKAVEVQNRDRKLADGLLKLIGDRCQFETASEIDPRTIRQQLFTSAHEARLARTFDRDAIVASAAAAFGTDVHTLERAMFSDLKSAHRLIAFDDLSAGELLKIYELSNRQAVLLRAIRVTVRLRCQNAQTLRYLFRQLRFRQLLFTLTAEPGSFYQLTIDGPFSLFRQSTRYGLQLALVLPAIEACDSYKLQAELRWGHQRRPLRFELEGNARSRAVGLTDPATVAPELHTLLERFEKRDTPWKVAIGDRVLSLPGVGVCIPDLVFSQKGQPPVYLELLGYWSREAVFKRIELLEKGLAERIIMAVPSRLRVSERALDTDLPGSIYVFKGALLAREIENRLELLAQRSWPPE